MIFINFITHKLLIFILSPIYLFFSGIVSSVLLSIPKAKITSKITKNSSKIWMYITFLFLKLLFINNVRLHYDPRVLYSKKTLLISNHVNNMDWFIIWISLLTLKKHKIYFNAKKSLLFYSKFLKKYSDNNTHFILLERNLNYDYITLVDSCDTLKKLKEYTSVLFPEGTILRDSSVLLNMKRGENRNISSVPKHTMIPKTKGFEIILDNLQYDLDSIIDCTLKYSCNISLKNFLKGEKSYIDVYFTSSEIPFTDKSDWLINKFREKEKMFETNNFLNKKLLTVNVNPPKRYYYPMTLMIPYIRKQIMLIINKIKF